MIILVNVRAPVAPRYYRHVILPRETRRKLLHRRYSNTSSSDEPSPTEEAIHEARERLRNLEQESEEIDRNFKEYRRRFRDLSPPRLRDREVRGSHNNDPYYRRRAPFQLSFAERYNISLRDMDQDLNRILDQNRDKSSDPGIFTIVQNDFPSTSTGQRFSAGNLHLGGRSSCTSVDSLKGKILKSREPSKSYLKPKHESVDREREHDADIMLDVMKILNEPSGLDQRCRENCETENDEQVEFRPSTAQSAASSGFLQEVLPGTSGVSLSSVDVSSDHEDLSLKLPKSNEKNGGL